MKTKIYFSILSMIGSALTMLSLSVPLFREGFLIFFLVAIISAGVVVIKMFNPEEIGEFEDPFGEPIDPYQILLKDGEPVGRRYTSD